MSESSRPFVRLDAKVLFLCLNWNKGTYQQVRMLAEVKRMMGTG